MRSWLSLAGALIVAGAAVLLFVWWGQASQHDTTQAYQKVLDTALATVDPRDDAAVATARREAVRRILSDMPGWASWSSGAHERLIYFRTNASGVTVPDRLRAKYPDLMGIVLQYQYRDLRVTEQDVVVTVSFNGVWETITIPLAALTSFEDRTVKFAIDIGDAGATQTRAVGHKPSSNDDPRGSGAMADKPYPYIYVNDDGTARELHPNERDYLETEFAPGDGNMPYIKSSYEERNGWGEIRGFMERSKLPLGTTIHPAPTEDPSRKFTRAEYMEYLRSKGLEVIENPDGSFTTRNPRQ